MTEHVQVHGHALVVRRAAPEELPWILGTWKRDAMVSEWAKRLRPKEYWAAVNYVVDRLAPNVLINVAALADEPTIAVGWLATRPGEILFGYTKPRFRNLGIDTVLRAAVPEARHRGFNAILELENLP